MSLSDLSQADLDQWAEHPVTLALHETLAEAHKAQVRMACEAYWRGQPWPEQDRLALRRMGSLLDDIFEPDLMMTLQTMETIHEYLGDSTR